MSKKLQLRIITPEKLIFDELVEGVTLPTTEGELTILPNHISMIASLSSGDIVARENEESIPFAVSGGFVEVKNENKEVITVAILADFAIHISSLSENIIENAKARAQELKKKKDNAEIVDFEHFESELERSLTQVRIADKWKKKKYRK